MDKYGGGGRGSAQDRSVWIKAYGGGPYIQDRAKGSRAVANLSVSILGAIQPDRLAEMGKLDSDGLLQRFLPVMMRNARPGRDLPRDPSVRRAVTDLFARFDSLPPAVFLLSEEARTVYRRMDEDMTLALRLTNPSPAFGSFCGKLPRTFATLALLLHCIDVVEGRAGPTDEVSEATAIAADHIVRTFLIPHGRLFYSQLAGHTDVSQQRAIAAAICRQAGPVIVLRDLVRGTHCLRKLNAADTQSALFPFVGGGWLTPLDRGPGNNRWHVTPGLAERFAREVEAQAVLAAEIQQRLRSKG
jgi:hypothetical protein